MSSSKPFIILFNPVRHAKSYYEDLQRVVRTEVVTSTSRKEFYGDIKNKYKDIMAIYRASASGAVAGNFDEDLIQHLPESCKFIYAVTEATVDLALWLLLGALRQTNPSLGPLRAGNFKKGVGFGNDPQGKVLGILGMGRIGRALKKRADPFDLVTHYHNRSPVPKEIEVGVEYVSYGNLLAESDIISVHVSLNASTKHLIKAEDIAKMKDGVVIVNTARGAIIDEAALADALKSGKIGAVGLDVYEKELIINGKLLKQERALLVPHLGTHTTETLAKMETWAMENARRGVLGEELLTPVPEHIELATSLRSKQH